MCRSSIDCHLMTLVFNEIATCISLYTCFFQTCFRLCRSATVLKRWKCYQYQLSALVLIDGDKLNETTQFRTPKSRLTFFAN